MVGCLAIEPGQADPHPARGKDEDRQQHQRQERDLPGDADHHHQRDRQGDEIAHHPRQGVAECALRADHVAVEAAHQGAGPGAREEGDWHALHVVEHRRAQIEDQVFADARGQPAGQQRERRRHQRDDGDDDGEPNDHADRIAGDDRVDHPPGQHRCGDGERGGDDAEQQVPPEIAPVRLREGGDATQAGTGERPPVALGVHRVVHRVPRGDFHAHPRGLLRCRSDRKTSTNLKVKDRTATPPARGQDAGTRRGLQ